MIKQISDFIKISDLEYEIFIGYETPMDTRGRILSTEKVYELFFSKDCNIGFKNIYLEISGSSRLVDRSFL